VNAREQFWAWCLERLQQEDAAEALDAVARRVLVETAALWRSRAPHDALGNLDWVGGQRGEGHPQAFFLPWSAGTLTPVHAHPNRMLVVLLRGGLLVRDYAGDGRSLIDERVLVPGQWVKGVDSARGYEHFPHSIESQTRSLSFHLYGDDPALGKRFDAAVC
jgi:hypothetical protein